MPYGLSKFPLVKTENHEAVIFYFSYSIDEYRISISIKCHIARKWQIWDLNTSSLFVESTSLTLHCSIINLGTKLTLKNGNFHMHQRYLTENLIEISHLQIKAINISESN